MIGQMMVNKIDLSVDIAGVHLDPPGSKPDDLGFYGNFGGRYVPETLVAALDEIDKTFDRCWKDMGFRTEFARLLGNYAGRPSPLTECVNLSEFTGFKVFLKREDLNHTGSHKINNVLGQALLAKEMGKTHLIAETGAGQHGVASATAAALLGMAQCFSYGTPGGKSNSGYKWKFNFERRSKRCDASLGVQGR